MLRKLLIWEISVFSLENEAHQQEIDRNGYGEYRNRGKGFGESQPEECIQQTDVQQVIE